MPAHYAWGIKQKPVKTVCVMNTLVTLLSGSVWDLEGRSQELLGIPKGTDHVYMEEKSQEEQSLNSMHIN